MGRPIYAGYHGLVHLISKYVMPHANPPPPRLVSTWKGSPASPSVRPNGEGGAVPRTVKAKVTVVVVV